MKYNDNKILLFSLFKLTWFDWTEFKILKKVFLSKSLDGFFSNIIIHFIFISSKSSYLKSFWKFIKIFKIFLKWIENWIKLLLLDTELNVEICSNKFFLILGRTLWNLIFKSYIWSPLEISSKKSIVLSIILILDSIVFPNAGLLFLLFEL